MHACRWGETLRQHVQGKLQLTLMTSLTSEKDDYDDFTNSSVLISAVAALSELFVPNSRSSLSGVGSYKPLVAAVSLTVGKVSLQLG